MSLLIPEQVLRFLNNLPVRGDDQESIVVFRDALRGLLSDVDRISVRVNMQCDIDDPEHYHSDVGITRYAGKTMHQVDETVRDMDDAGSDPVGIDALRQQGFPVDDYYPPVRYDYLFGGHADLGTILLWRERGRSAISQDTLETMAALEPFLIYSLSDIVLRYKRTQPVAGVFDEAVNTLVADAGLTTTEVRVVLLLLLGRSYKDMVDILGVTMDTVKYHLKTIYRKTGTRSGNELFAKYFTPRFGISSTDK
jgi:DNA-binding CsgD family transcriptional regulator